MKKLALIGFIFCCIGCMLCVFGWLLGGKISKVAMDVYDRVVWSMDVVEKVEEDSVKYEEAFVPKQALHVYVENAKFEVIQGDTDKVILQNIDREDVHITTKDEVVDVNIKGTLDKKQRVIIQLEDVTVIRNISLESNKGDSVLANMEVDSMDIKTYTGIVQLQNMVSYATNIENTYGQLIVKEGKFHQTKIDNDKGKIQFQGDLYGKNEIDCQMGNITLQLQRKKEEYQYDVQVDMGVVVVGDDKMIGSDVEVVEKGQDDRFMITCNMGKVTVDFAS